MVKSQTPIGAGFWTGWRALMESAAEPANEPVTTPDQRAAARRVAMDSWRKSAAWCRECAAPREARAGPGGATVYECPHGRFQVGAREW